MSRKKRHLLLSISSHVHLSCDWWISIQFVFKQGCWFVVVVIRIDGRKKRNRYWAVLNLIQSSRVLKRWSNWLLSGYFYLRFILACLHAVRIPKYDIFYAWQLFIHNKGTTLANWLKYFWTERMQHFYLLYLNWIFCSVSDGSTDWLLKMSKYCCRFFSD